MLNYVQSTIFKQIEVEVMENYSPLLEITDGRM